MILVYSVDGADRITDITGPWDEFAAANGAPGLTAATQRGKSLPELVTGVEMQLLTTMLLRRARGGTPLRLPFRCDAPDERRFLEMHLQGQGNGGVQIESRLLRAESRLAVALLEDHVPRTDEVVYVCSWCKRARLPRQEWVEIEAAVEELRLFGPGPLPQVSHGICPACRASFFS
ncbi:MAG: hypothetical protein NDJ94_24220 [Vicinamibacteria bacterium]|nr:hypothetical protein [Vicinamibacteria bacterium]